MKKKKTGKKSLRTEVDEATIQRRYELIGIALAAVAVLSLCGLLGFNAGFVGLWLARFFRYCFGVGSWIFVLALLWFGGVCVMKHQEAKYASGIFGFVGLMAFALAFYHHFAVQPGAEILPESLPTGGGLLGGGLLFLLRKFVGVSGGLVVVLAGLLGSFLWTTKWSLSSGILKTRDTARTALVSARERIEERRERRRAEEEARRAEEEKQEPPAAPVPALTEITADARKGVVYDQNLDDHFTEVSASPVAGGETPAEPKASMVVARPKQGTPAREGFLARLRRRSEARTRMAAMKPEENQPTEEPQENTEHAPEEAVVPSGTEGAASVVPEEGTAADAGDALTVESPSDDENGAADGQDASFAETETTNEAVAEAESAPAEIETADAADSEEVPAAGFSIEYSRDVKPEETVPEAERLSPEEERDALARAMSRALGHEDFLEEAEDEGEKEYRLPEISEILEKRPAERDGELEREISENARVLAKTLEDFRVKADIINACHGPAVTRYELKPAPGVKVSKIENLADDLALALAAFSVRIEPVPGKAAIGVEVPNRTLEGVTLRDVLEDEGFLQAESPLTVGLGIDIAGQAIFADLGAMPHLLIAGATGSGKSVCVNTLITSILFKARPDEVKFIMIDPKMVELSNYNGIPHLMVPVVTDSKKAASVLNWAVQEMEKRYAKFAELSVKKMADYNAAVPEEKMPAIVIIIDELADLMMVAPKDVEEAIFRLAQKARAAGIHLVLATQRPSVDVITGTIKTNIPSRISFAVSSQIDSRTILDTRGAEKLLGKGDMLFYPIGAAKPMRVQGAFISDEEIERLLEFVRSQGEEPEPDEEIIRFTEAAEESADDKEKSKGKASQQDELLEKAVELVLATGQASTSSIQRRFRIGYTRAGRLIDTMEELGIVGPNVGSKPREILVMKEEAEKILAGLGETAE